MEGHITIDVDKNLDDNMNADYIENKIKKLSSYIKGKMKEQENVIINVVVNFNDGKSVCFYEWNVLPLIRVLLENKYYTYTPYEYLKSIQGN